MRQIILDFGKVYLFDYEFTLRVYGYGLMLVLGFLLAIYLARWRTRRMGENPDVATYIGLVSLVSGVLGARIAYIIQKWDEFSHAPNPLTAMMDITSGGLIYYGGLITGILAVAVYLRIKHLSVRRFLDILAPSLMVGLAFGRLGCLLNGCCFGGMCDDQWKFGMHFPMYSKPLVNFNGSAGPFSKGTENSSPAYDFQYNRGLVQPDERLTFQVGRAIGLHAPRYLHGRLANDQLDVMLGDRERARLLFDEAAPSGLMDYKTWQAAFLDANGPLRGSEFWDEAITFSTARDIRGQPVLSFDDFWNYTTARRNWLFLKFSESDGKLSDWERRNANEYLGADLFEIAANERSEAVRPSQAIGAINAFLLAALLGSLHRLRSREGQLFAMLLIMYPITRFVEELIRADNPHNLAQFQFTHNQITSVIMLLGGVAMLLILRKFSPSAGPALAQRQGVTRNKETR